LDRAWKSEENFSRWSVWEGFPGKGIETRIMMVDLVARSHGMWLEVKVGHQEKRNDVYFFCVISDKPMSSL
jgi:hypothetical protein